MDVRKQLRQQTQSLQSTSQTDASTYQTISESPTPREVLGENIIKSFLLGFKTNIAILCPDKSYKTAFSRQTVSIHLSSVLADRDRNKKMEGIVFCDFVFTQKAYARNVSAIQLQWLDELWQKHEDWGAEWIGWVLVGGWGDGATGRFPRTASAGGADDGGKLTLYTQKKTTETWLQRSLMQKEASKQVCSLPKHTTDAWSSQVTGPDLEE